jgi:hypothetical protein
MRPLSLILAGFLALGAVQAHAQVSYTSMPLDKGFGELDQSTPPELPEQIISAFEQQESTFSQALAHYTYRRSVRVETLDDDGKVDGQYFEVTDIVADPNGKLYEHVVEAPSSSLERVMMTPADFDDIEHRFPFVLTQENAGQYTITFVGRQPVDEVACYVFDVKPKVIEKGHRYFQGRIWVDERDKQIVVTNGKNVPDDLRKGHEDLSTPFTTYRQQIDGKYWFPVYTKGDGILHFPAGRGTLGQDVHLRTTVKYTDYKRFGTSVRITYEGQEVQKAPEQPAPAPPSPPHP